MKKVYTNQNIAMVGAVRSYLAEHGIVSQLRNEFSSGVMGEISFFEVWPELWVDDLDYFQAQHLVKELDQETPSGPDWKCEHCGEENPGSFEICWQCSTLLA